MTSYFSKDKGGKTIRINTEIDFVLDTLEGKYYIQSALDIAEESKRAQETRSFRGLSDFRTKIVVDHFTPKPYTDQAASSFCNLRTLYRQP